MYPARCGTPRVAGCRHVTLYEGALDQSCHTRPLSMCSAVCLVHLVHMRAACLPSHTSDPVGGDTQALIMVRLQDAVIFTTCTHTQEHTVSCHQWQYEASSS